VNSQRRPLNSSVSGKSCGDRNMGLKPVRPAPKAFCVGTVSAECNSAGRTDLKVYVPSPAQHEQEG